jgi:hypothetical protein
MRTNSDISFASPPNTSTHWPASSDGPPRSSASESPARSPDQTRQLIGSLRKHSVPRFDVRSETPECSQTLLNAGFKLGSLWEAAQWRHGVWVPAVDQPGLLLGTHRPWISMTQQPRPWCANAINFCLSSSTPISERTTRPDDCPTFGGRRCRSETDRGDLIGRARGGPCRITGPVLSLAPSRT